MMMFDGYRKFYTEMAGDYFASPPYKSMSWAVPPGQYVNKYFISTSPEKGINYIRFFTNANQSSDYFGQYVDGGW